MIRHVVEHIYERWAHLLWRPYGAGSYAFTRADVEQMSIDELSRWCAGLDEMRRREADANKK